jgi:DNA-binding LacI/PurR family transcriptional regulator
MGRVTLQTIADELGVSRTTVSNAYSRPNQLAPKLRERILETAQRLGYAGPDAAARTLRRGRSGAIGLLFNEPLTYALSDPFATTFLHGFAESAEQHNVNLLITSMRDDDLGVSTVQSAVVDGFCVFCLEEDSPIFEAVRRRALPVVQLFGSDDPTVSYVSVDDRGAAVDAARYLIELGHRRLAVIVDGGIPLGHFGPVDPDTVRYRHNAHSRLTGYLDAAREAGIDPRSVPFVRAPENTTDAGKEAMGRLLDLDPRPTGVLCISDVLAIGALSALDERGLVAGRDVSVIGFDDIPLAARTGLTTVRQPGREKGRVAGRLLLDPPDKPEDRRVLLPTELVVRESSGPEKNEE